jgi:hypothetical protein
MKHQCVMGIFPTNGDDPSERANGAQVAGRGAVANQKSGKNNCRFSGYTRTRCPWQQGRVARCMASTSI